eukprot:1151836-Pelagomonas_calceolata.AAC.1
MQCPLIGPMNTPLAMHAQRVGKAASDAMPLDRTNEHTAGYAAACLDVGKELGVPCVDLYGRLQKEQVRQELYNRKERVEKESGCGVWVCQSTAERAGEAGAIQPE